MQVAKSTQAEKAASEVAAAAEQVAYQQLKQELQTATAGLGALCFAAAYAFYSKVSTIDVKPVSHSFGRHRRRLTLRSRRALFKYISPFRSMRIFFSLSALGPTIRRT